MASHVLRVTWQKIFLRHLPGFQRLQAEVSRFWLIFFLNDFCTLCFRRIVEITNLRGGDFVYIDLRIGQQPDKISANNQLAEQPVVDPPAASFDTLNAKREPFSKVPFLLFSNSSDKTEISLRWFPQPALPLRGLLPHR